jgi:hypothetical protein
MNLEFSDRFSKNTQNMKFHENPSSGSQVVPCRQMDRHDEVTVCFSQFCLVHFVQYVGLRLVFHVPLEDRQTQPPNCCWFLSKSNGHCPEFQLQLLHWGVGSMAGAKH